MRFLTVLAFLAASMSVHMIFALSCRYQDWSQHRSLDKGRRRTLRAGGMNRQVATRDIAWTCASSSFGSYTTVFTASHFFRTDLVFSENKSTVSSSYLLASASSVVRSSTMRRPVWPSPAVMRILREDEDLPRARRLGLAGAGALGGH